MTELKQIPIRCKGNRYLPFKDFRRFQGNLKEMSKENAIKLEQSILEYGWIAPVFVWGNNILDGHGRLLVLEQLLKKGYTIDDIPVVDIEAKSKKEAAEILLTINSKYQTITAEGLYEFMSEMDLKLEDLDLIELPDIDLEQFEQEYFIEKQDSDLDDEIPDVEEVKTKTGDLYMLGEHRLLCGDATKKKDIEKLMDGTKADMVFTDPPYGMNLDTNFSSMFGICRGKRYSQVINDDKPFDPTFIFEFFSCKEIFLWGADYYAEKIPNRNSGSWLVWDKVRDGERLGCDDEYDKMFGSNFELCWSKAKHKRALVRVLWKGIFGLHKEDTKKRIHPTQKPADLVVWFLEKFSRQNSIIIDLFLGSGSTLIACEKTNRICYGMEIDPYYCDVIITRYVNYTGNNEIILNGKKIAWQS